MEAFKGYDKDKLFEALYSGLITEFNLPVGVYQRTHETLIPALVDNFKTGLQYGSEDFYVLRELKNNIYFFSAAKTFIQVYEMRGAMVEGDKIISFSDFRKKAESIFKEYNENYLKTEYDTTIGQSQMASEWSDIVSNKKLFPYLQYSAVIDSRTSQICAGFNGIVLPVNDPFWRKYSPLNHFNCRCRLLKVDRYEEPTIATKKQIEAGIEHAKENGMQKVFEVNPYFDKQIFSEKHPYFKVSTQYKELAKNNFNLQIPNDEKEIIS